MSTQKNEQRREAQRLLLEACAAEPNFTKAALNAIQTALDRRITPPTDTTGSGKEGVNYDGPAPETEAFMTLIDDSAVDLGQIQGKLAQFECERDAALAELEGRGIEAEALQRFIQTIEKAVPGVGLPNPIDSAESKLVQLVAQVEALRRDGERFSRALERIGFFFAGTEHQRIADATIYIFKGMTIDEALRRAAIDSAQRQEAE